MDKKIIIRTFLVGVALSLPLVLISIFGDVICGGDWGLFSPCAWFVFGLFWWLYLFMLTAGFFYLLFLFRKPKFYRAVIIMGLSSFTLFIIGFWGLSIEFGDSEIIFPIISFIFFVLVYPIVHLGYYWLFNSFLTRFEK